MGFCAEIQCLQMRLFYLEKILEIYNVSLKKYEH